MDAHLQWLTRKAKLYRVELPPFFLVNSYIMILSRLQMFDMLTEWPSTQCEATIVRLYDPSTHTDKTLPQQ